MSEKKTAVGANVERAERAAWKCPQILRLEAGLAEIGSAARTDALNTAS